MNSADRPPDREGRGRRGDGSRFAENATQQVQQALDNESGNLQAVSATLVNPHSSQTSRLQTLATSLQSSLVPIDPVASGASASVSGTSSLTSCANGASARARHRAQAQQHSAASNSASSGSSSSSSASTSSLSSHPYANGGDRGGGLYAVRALHARLRRMCSAAGLRSGAGYRQARDRPRCRGRRARRRDERKSRAAATLWELLRWGRPEIALPFALSDNSGRESLT